MGKLIFGICLMIALTACGGSGGSNAAVADCSKGTTLGSATFGTGCFN
jgi:hypothetical protein